MEEKKIDGRPYIRFLSYFSIILAIIFLIFGLVAAVAVFIYLREGIFYKKMLIALAFVMGALVTFFVFFGLYNLIKNYLYVSKKVILEEEEIEEGLEEIDKKLT